MLAGSVTSLSIQRFIIMHLKYLLASLLLWPVLAWAQVNQGLPVVELRIGQHRLKAEVAADPASRTIGLMNRFSLAPDSGMLFVFPESQPLAFWMKNTYVPLSIAFLDDRGAILNIEDMKPRDERTTPSRGPARYALEMKQGWFRERGIQAGQRVLGLDKAGPGR